MAAPRPKNPFHIVYVVVARSDDGYCFVAACMDEEAALDLPDAWDAMKEEQAKLHGVDNIRTARLKLKHGWMEPLFNIPSIQAETAVLNEHRDSVTGCDDCPFKIPVMSRYYCGHPGVRHKCPSLTEVLTSPNAPKLPEWCPLSLTPVVVELKR
jgi:hypothetical protein